MAEIDYIKEKCWLIKEMRPIDVIKSRKCEDRIIINIRPMTMRYETFSEITTVLNNLKYAEYDYTNGEARISVTDEGLRELEELKNIITIK